MPVADISEVTKAVVAIIDLALHDHMAAPPPVVPDLPIRTNQDCIGFYLYHITENANYKNDPAPGKNNPPVRYTPMGLNLYYQLTANFERNDGEAAFDEQIVMSIAMKALHDNPVVFSLGDDNKFRISLQPVPATDAVHNWTAGSSAIKLSAYYEIGTIFLEPEKSKSYTGRVLTYGNYILTERTPRITGSFSMVEFLVPGETTKRTVKIQPAQAVTGKTFFFNGSGFNSGQLTLRIYNSFMGTSAMADETWNVTPSTLIEVVVTIGKTAFSENDGTQKTVLPGIYSGQILSTIPLTLPNGEVRNLTTGSNQFPFVVSPEITAVGAVVANKVAITGSIFQHPDLLDEETEVYIGEKRILRSTGLFDPGEFNVTSPTNMDIHLPNGLSAGNIPVRILIRGAESLPPSWIRVL